MADSEQANELTAAAGCAALPASTNEAPAEAAPTVDSASNEQIELKMNGSLVPPPPPTVDPCAAERGLEQPDGNGSDATANKARDSRHSIIRSAQTIQKKQTPQAPAFDLRPVLKALRRDSDAGNLLAVEASLAEGRHPVALGEHLDAATMGLVLKLLIKFGRIQPAELLLRQKQRDVGLDILMEALALMPQTSGRIDPDQVVRMTYPAFPYFLRTTFCQHSLAVPRRGASND